MSRPPFRSQRNHAAQYTYISPPGSDQPRLEIDGSTDLFALYMERAEREDKEVAERWKTDADNILIFSSLFSATIATSIGYVFPDLKPSSQDTSNFYLSNIYQLLSSANGSQTHLTPLPVPPAFSAPPSSIWVNSLWFLGLIMSLTCALVAIMLQQWARLYLTTPHPGSNLLREARIREFLDEGVQKFRLSLVAEALRALHHTSFFLFLAGLVVLLYNIHFTVFVVVAAWVGLVALAYVYFTYVPIFWRNAPYYTPLSPLIWNIALTFLTIPRYLVQLPYLGSDSTSWRRLEEAYRKRRRQGIRGAAEEIAQAFSGEFDRRAMLWTFRSLNDDHDIQRFIAGIPSFCSSKAVEEPVECIAKLGDEGLSEALVSLMHRALTSNLISPAKEESIRIYTNAMRTVPALASWRALRRVFGDWRALLGSIDFGRSIVRGLGKDPRTDLCVRCIVSVITVRSQGQDGWSNLVTDHLGISNDILELYNSRSRSNVLLANLVIATRQIFRYHSEHPKDALFNNVSTKTLDELTPNVNAQRASSELQQYFCTLWNEIVPTAQDGRSANVRSVAREILKRLRKVYISLHENPDPENPTGFYAPSDGERNSILSRGSSYPFCGVQSHQPHSST